jgi:hypothetical protein
LTTQNSLPAEFLDAIHGCLALLSGQRDAGKHFNLTFHGFVGSLAAVVAMFGLDYVVESIIVGGSGKTGLWNSTLIFVSIYVGTVAVEALILRWLGKADRLIAYLVVSNWTSTILSVFLWPILLVDPTVSRYLSIVIFLPVLVIWINSLRFIVELHAWGIVQFLLVQIVSLFAFGSIVQALY